MARTLGKTADDVGASRQTATVYSLLLAAIGDEERSKDRPTNIPQLDWPSMEERTEELDIVPIEEGKIYLLPSSLTGEVIQRWEYQITVPVLRQFLARAVSTMITRHGIECVIFDGKAGPDPLNLAVAGICSATLIISEFDPVTWDGTLNFREYIRSEYGRDEGLYVGSPARISFVLNKIPAKFYPRRGGDISEERFSQFLQQIQILARFSFDYDYFESFGEFTFAVDERPDSLFSIDLAGLAVSLLDKSYPQLLDDSVRSLASRRAMSLRRALLSENQRLPFLVALGGISLALASVWILAIGTEGINRLLEDPLRITAVGFAIAGVTIAAIGFFYSRVRAR